MFINHVLRNILVNLRNQLKMLMRGSLYFLVKQSNQYKLIYIAPSTSAATKTNDRSVRIPKPDDHEFGTLNLNIPCLDFLFKGLLKKHKIQTNIPLFWWISHWDNPILRSLHIQIHEVLKEMQQTTAKS